MATDTTTANHAEIKHFLRLAARGRHAASSGGEKAARRLAQCILSHVPGLDAEAIAGAIQFIHAAKHAPQTARELLR